MAHGKAGSGFLTKRADYRHVARGLLMAHLREVHDRRLDNSFVTLDELEYVHQAVAPECRWRPDPESG